MNKDKARIILEDWMSEEKIVSLPLVDEVIYNESDYVEWTFIGLMCEAYSLQKKKI